MGAGDAFIVGDPGADSARVVTTERDLNFRQVSRDGTFPRSDATLFEASELGIPTAPARSLRAGPCAETLERRFAASRG